MRDRKLTGPWAGFSFQNGYLITPEGRAMEPWQLSYLSLTCDIAREWTKMMEEGRLKSRPKRPANVIFIRDRFRKKIDQKPGSQVVATGFAAECAGSSLPKARRRKGRE
ncbi:DUF3653 domain-containing protein [Xanthomonas citri]|uniref:DUF3653 domain-containing protein n=1 Tax=Xanthomonas citri TaxID=346 RepID=UPI000543DD24|nr:DUF3653 domain-containing protein [Xanthomonas citri]ATS69029.1 hypothetical protein XcfCFBP6165P_17390 [Xanthomonas citri pv. phaseoli var. fuscans]ATS78022.1 hypothetical protein XcfCFBP6975P_21820 [Xanthomonas citri pv. phaseoli var. fuscans]ATS80417.1 hypothetical protein XcfCFBP7767P_12020 [Xanthomonas citri pv. phaseoli var. fuscans]ATS90117.1 hypothetical protein XcfCFBP6167P_19070 [Xanthomonas citri pv. phaseoli var. fuscans]AZU17640.1 hypothetical protein AC613_11270 [Xanthomonas c